MSREEQKLVEFLAWVEDNFTYLSDNDYLGVHDANHYTREEIVEQFKNTML